MAPIQKHSPGDCTGRHAPDELRSVGGIPFRRVIPRSLIIRPGLPLMASFQRRAAGTRQAALQWSLFVEKLPQFVARPICLHGCCCCCCWRCSQLVASYAANHSSHLPWIGRFSPPLGGALIALTRFSDRRTLLIRTALLSNFDSRICTVSHILSKLLTTSVQSNLAIDQIAAA